MEHEDKVDRVIAVLDLLFAEDSGESSSPYPEPASIETQTSQIYDEFVSTAATMG